MIQHHFHPLPVLLLLLCSCTTELPETSTDADAILIRNEDLRKPIDSTLFDSLTAIERRCGCRLGVAAINIESGWRTAWNGDETFPMASVAKLPMALAFLREVDNGRLRLDSIVTLTSADHQPGASTIYHRVSKTDGQVSLHDLLVASITESDNTAADKLLHLTGGPSVADSLMRELELPEIDISSYEGELILKWAGVDPVNDTAWTRERMYASMKNAGKEAWDSAGARLLNDPSDAATPDAVARLLVKLHEGKILSSMMTDTLLAIMHRTITGKGRIRGRLPEGTLVGNKTGTIGSVANDVGIVTLPEGKGHLAVVVFIKNATTGKRQRDAAIADVAALVYRRVLAPAQQPIRDTLTPQKVKEKNAK
jgi:beta-lactamase class A